MLEIYNQFLFHITESQLKRQFQFQVEWAESNEEKTSINNKTEKNKNTNTKNKKEKGVKGKLFRCMEKPLLRNSRGFSFFFLHF